MFFKIVVLKNLQYSQENISVGSLFDKISSLKSLKETPAQVFSCEYYKIFKNALFAEHLRWLLL